MLVVYKKTIALLLTLFVLAISSTRVEADSVRLKNGDAMTGLLVSFSDGVCVFNSTYGATLYFKVDDVKSFTTDRSFEVMFTNGDVVKGKFFSDNGTDTSIVSEHFGKVSVSISNISSATAIVVADKTQQGENKKSNTSEQEKIEYGQKVDKEPPLDFLSGTTVLLKPGVFDFDMSFNYKQSKMSYKLPYSGYFERSTYSARQLELALAVRAGLWEGAEGNIRVPFTYSQVTDISTSEWVRSQDKYSVGDISFGLQQTLLKESASIPAITASFTVMAPTGSKSYPETLNSWLEPLDNGRGFWTISPGLSFVKTVDPAIIFGGVNYQYSFENTIDGYRVQPGSGVTGYLGVGFALNDKLSLGARVSQSYFADMKYDGKIIQGTFTEPLDLAFTASYRIFDNWVVSPEVRFGLNDDAGASNVGIRFTRRF